MSFDNFKAVVGALAKANGVGVVFLHDTEKNRFLASCDDGLLITAHPSALKVTFQNGRYHTFQARFSDLARAV